MNPAVSDAAMHPVMYPDCNSALAQARCLPCSVSLTSAEPAAHSPPMPSAAMNRKISKCHHAVAKNDSPVNTAYVSTVSVSVRARPSRSPTRPKTAPPTAHPIRNTH